MSIRGEEELYTVPGRSSKATNLAGVRFEHINIEENTEDHAYKDVYELHLAAMVDRTSTTGTTQYQLLWIWLDLKNNISDMSTVVDSRTYNKRTAEESFLNKLVEKKYAIDVEESLKIADIWMDRVSFGMRQEIWYELWNMVIHGYRVDVEMHPIIDIHELLRGCGTKEIENMLNKINSVSLLREIYENGVRGKVFDAVPSAFLIFKDRIDQLKRMGRGDD